MTQLLRRQLLLLGVSGTLHACGGAPPKTRDSSQSELPPYRGPLVRPEDIRENFLWQQRVAATHEGRSGAFNAVLQKQGEELLVLGLTPFGTRGFSLKQKGRDFKYEQYVPFELPFSPEAVLIDIHRTFFFQLLKGTFPRTGRRTATWENETVRDEFRNARLVKRTFTDVVGSGKSIEIDYSADGYMPFSPPDKVTIRNRAYGYTLTVTTSATQPL